MGKLDVVVQQGDEFASRGVDAVIEGAADADILIERDHPRSPFASRFHGSVVRTVVDDDRFQFDPAGPTLPLNRCQQTQQQLARFQLGMTMETVISRSKERSRRGKKGGLFLNTTSAQRKATAPRRLSDGFSQFRRASPTALAAALLYPSRHHFADSANRRRPHAHPPHPAARRGRTAACFDQDHHRRLTERGRSDAPASGRILARDHRDP